MISQLSSFPGKYSKQHRLSIKSQRILPGGDLTLLEKQNLDFYPVFSTYYKSAKISYPCRTHSVTAELSKTLGWGASTKTLWNPSELFQPNHLYSHIGTLQQEAEHIEAKLILPWQPAVIHAPLSSSPCLLYHLLSCLVHKKTNKNQQLLRG